MRSNRNISIRDRPANPINTASNGYDTIRGGGGEILFEKQNSGCGITIVGCITRAQDVFIPFR